MAGMFIIFQRDSGLSGLRGCQNDNYHIEPSEQRLQEISIAKNWPRARLEPFLYQLR